MTGPTYISWAPHCSRSDHTARELGGRSHMVYWEALGSRPATVWLKYGWQAWRTWQLLRAERPASAFVMSPPVFAVLPVAAYCRLAGIPYVIDAHSAAFMHPRWRSWQWLQRRVSLGAATTIVHNTETARLVNQFGGHATLVPDIPIEYERVEAFTRGPEFTVAAVCSFNYDEPVEAMIEAMRQLPDTRFHVTGKRADMPSGLPDRLPPNVHLTGFLSFEAYGGMLRDVDAVLSLTTRDGTMLRSAYEAVYQGTPVVVSDWPILQDAFDEGAEHVGSDAGSIAEGLRRMQASLTRHREGVARLRERKRERWMQTRASLAERLAATPR